MPPVYKTLFEQAPGVSLTCLNRQPDMMEKLSLGEADLSFSSDVQNRKLIFMRRLLAPIV